MVQFAALARVVRPSATAFAVLGLGLAVVLQPPPVLAVSCAGGSHTLTLSGGTAAPGSGTTATPFAFSVRYRDNAGCVPSMIDLVVPGVGHFALSGPATIDPAGVRFTTSQTLPPGTWAYRFEAASGTGAGARTFTLTQVSPAAVVVSSPPPPTPTPTPKPTPKPTPRPTPRPTPPASPTPTASAVPVATPAATATPGPTDQLTPRPAASDPASPAPGAGAMGGSGAPRGPGFDANGPTAEHPTSRGPIAIARPPGHDLDSLIAGPAGLLGGGPISSVAAWSLAMLLGLTVCAAIVAWPSGRALAIRPLLPARRHAPLRFGEPPLDGFARRMVRHRRVRMADRPDEMRSNEIARLDLGDEVELLEAADGWAQVATPHGLTGWVPGSALSTSDRAT